MKLVKVVSLLFIFNFLITVSSYAQITWVQMGVNGLTCSQCTRSVEMSIRKLDFVEDVQMNLENTEGKVTFKPNAKVNVEEVAKAVEQAGFSVRYLKAGVVFSNVQVSTNFCYSFENNFYQFIKIQDQLLKGETAVIFVGKHYMPGAEQKKFKSEMKPNCKSTKGKNYFVTLQ